MGTQVGFREVSISDFQGKILHFDDTIDVYFLFHNLRFNILMSINIAY